MQWAASDIEKSCHDSVKPMCAQEGFRTALLKFYCVLGHAPIIKRAVHLERTAAWPTTSFWG
jgi:hypothetical protein